MARRWGRGAAPTCYVDLKSHAPAGIFTIAGFCWKAPPLHNLHRACCVSVTQVARKAPQLTYYAKTPTGNPRYPGRRNYLRKLKSYSSFTQSSCVAPLETPSALQGLTAKPRGLCVFLLLRNLAFISRLDKLEDFFSSFKRQRKSLLRVAIFPQCQPRAACSREDVDLRLFTSTASMSLPCGYTSTPLPLPRSCIIHRSPMLGAVTCLVEGEKVFSTKQPL